MKQIFFLITLFASSYTYSFHESPTIAETRVCLQQASPRDAQLLLNLAYWSFQRSHANIVGTNSIIAQVEQAWKLWQNYTQTRLNPERKLPYPDATLLDSQACNNTYERHVRNNKCYAIMLEHLLKTSAINNVTKEYITLIRAQARMSVTHAIWENMHTLKGTLGQLQTTLAQSAQAFAEKTSYHAMHKNMFTDGVEHLVNGMGLRTFVTFDREYNENSDKLMYALIKSQTAFHELWQIIERTRAEFYQRLYTMIYTSMVELKFPRSSFMQAYTMQGPLSFEEQKELLPAQLDL